MIIKRTSGDIDKLISSCAHCKFVAAPVFGRPTAADAGKLLIVMSGDYRSKKEVAHLTVPGVGRKVIDLGGNIEKGGSSRLFIALPYPLVLEPLLSN